MQIEVFRQSAIKLKGKITIYFDPFKIDKDYHDADYIFITHDHYDHYDLDSIQKVMQDKTTLVVPKILATDAQNITSNVIIVEPNKEYRTTDFTFSTRLAYNLEKRFHPKEKGYVGYILELDKQKYYIMGDTDALDENTNLDVDYCFIPIGGTYTMDVKESAEYINKLKPKVAIPIHYGSIVGSITLGEEFKKLINQNIDVRIYIKEEEK